MQKRRRTRIRRRRFLADDLRIDRQYVSCLGEIMKEIIVREGFLPRQPWQAKRRTIGRVAGQRGTNVLCATFLSSARIKAILFSGDFCNNERANWHLRCCIRRKNSRKYLIIGLLIFAKKKEWRKFCNKVWQTASIIFNQCLEQKCWRNAWEEIERKVDNFFQQWRIKEEG